MENKVLILEDEALIATGIGLHLEANGYGYEIAENPDKALELLAEYKFAAAICDINLNHRMTGIEFVEQHLGDTLPVVFLTAYTDFETMKKAEQTTPYAYLTKPFDKNHLLITLNLAIINHKRRFVHQIPEHIDLNEVSLTDRELEIVRLIAESKTNEEIGEKLFISTQTVATHRKNIMKKTGARNVIELVSIAVEKRWI